MQNDYKKPNLLRRILLILWIITGGLSLKAQAPTAAFSASTLQGCAPLSVNFTNNSTGAASYQWIFGNGNFSTLTNPQNVYVGAGTYSVSLIAIAANGQRDTLTQNAYITAAPGPNTSFIASSLNGCVGQTAFNFTNTSTGAVSYFWDFDDGTSSLQQNPSKVYSQVGTYTVSLLATNSNGCQSVYNLATPLTVNPVPNAAFAANLTLGCSPSQAFLFTPANQVSGSNYLWNFGDGTTSTTAVPSKTYSNPGVYTVSLVITNSFGCSDTVTRTNYISVQTPLIPVITASVDSGCVPLITQLSSNVTNASSYAWNFGNGQTGTNPGATVNYGGQGGTFSPSLTVTMDNGCSYTGTATNLIQAFPLPTTQFSLTNNNGCAPLTPVFNNTSTGATSYFWQSNGGLTSNEFEPNYTFTQGGVYFIRLTSTSAHGCSSQVQINSLVHVNSPIANFTAANTSGCPPLGVQFTNTSTSGTSYLWQFGDGTTSTQQSPTHVYNQLGDYDVTLIVSGGSGCTDTLSMADLVSAGNEVAVYTPPAEINACTPFTASFDIQQNPGETYTWDFGDGTTATGPSPIHQYTEPGTYNVSLLVNDGGPCGLIYPVYQTINLQGDVPEFTTTINPCPPHQVTFDDNIDNVVSWVWDFGDNTGSTDENPVHIYPNMLNHHVGLTVTTDLGCVYSYIGFNAVNFSSAFATFTSTYAPGDFPQTVQFTSTNPLANSWFWDFGDGTTSTEENPTHVYQSEANYEVTLEIEMDNCSASNTLEPFDSTSEDVDQDTVSTNNYPPGSENLLQPLLGCAPMNISFFKQNPTHLVLEWHFGDGSISTEQNPIHFYGNAGVYSVFYTAITPYGLDTIEYQQSIRLGGGIPDFSVSQDVLCESTIIEVSIANPDAVESLVWNFGGLGTDSTLTASWEYPNTNSANLIQVTVIDTMGCSNSRMKSVLPVRPVPSITYPTSVCNDTIQFTHNLSNLPGYTYLWEFGDGTTSTDVSPEHYYLADGIYEVTLHLTTPEGCDLVFVLPNEIKFAHPIPSNTLSVTEGCTPLQITFTNTTPNVYQVAWFFSDGSNSLAQWNGSHYIGPKTLTFTNPGTYGFYQRVTSNLILNCVIQEAFGSMFTVYDAEADFSFTQEGLCAPIDAQFTDLSEDAVSWLWDFGNGETSTEQNPHMVFESFPADSITLSITNSHGCTDTKTRAGLATLQADASASYIGNCNPLPVDFHATELGMVDWQWNFGDGSTGTGANPHHLYTENGNYTATVIVTSAEGCQDTVSLEFPIDVNGPVPAFHSPTPANCAPSVVEFLDTSINTVSWLWDFGDGTSATVQNPVKLYDNPGVYDVTLIATGPNGCSDTLFKPQYVTVLGPATTFTASAASACVGALVNFQDLSDGAVVWEWNFGEGNISHEQHPSFTYNEPGSFVVTLFSEDTLGCSAFYTIPLPIQINPFPTAGFSLSDSSMCAPMQITAENLSSGASTYQWLVNGSSQSTAFEPSFTMASAGVFEIELIATTEFGCADTASISGVESYLVPIANFTVDHTEGCTPLSVSFNNSSYQTLNPSYLWDFGNGETSTVEQATETFYNPQFYSISLTVTNENGCADTLLVPSLVQVFDTSAAPICPILRVTVENTQAVRIEWEESVAEDFGSYLIYRKNAGTGEFDLIQEITDAHTLAYVDEGLNTLDNVYCYKLQTMDRCGYNIAIDSLIEHCSINVEATLRENHTISVDWTPYIGKTPSQYRVYRTEENTSNVEDLGTVAGDVTNFIDSTVFCPLTYRYDIKAEGLNGQWHVESNSDFDISDRLPNLFVDQQVDASRSTVVDNRFVMTEWRRPAVMGNRVSSYHVFRSTDNQLFSKIASLPPEQTFYVDEAVDVDHVKYFYRIMATNSCGIEGKQGGFSDNIVLSADPAGDFYIQLRWTPYTGWGENGVGFYILERETEDGSWEVIHQVPGTVTTAVDEN